IKELPTTNPKPEEIANEAKGEKLLFNGLDLDGWKAEDGAWKAGGGVLRCTGSTPISTVAKFGPGSCCSTARYLRRPHWVWASILAGRRSPCRSSRAPGRDRC